MEILKIYVDGSWDTKTNYAGFGLVVTQNEEIIYQEFGKCPEVSLSRQIDGELHASKRALQYLIDNKINGPAEIYCDYIGIKHWYEGTWKAKGPVAVSYKRFCNYVQRTYNLNVTFHHVKGHSGNIWNEYADKLADKGKRV